MITGTSAIVLNHLCSLHFPSLLIKSEITQLANINSFNNHFQFWNNFLALSEQSSLTYFVFSSSHSLNYHQYFLEFDNTKGFVNFFLHSFNSSFSECVRNRSFPKQSSSLNTVCNPDYKKCWKEVNFIDVNKTILPSTSTGNYDFSFCEWNRCSSDTNGGGICCTTSSSTLSLSDCSFYSCSASNDGGGAYISSASTASFERCSFLFGSALSSGNENGGAGICGRSITNSIWVSSCSFFSGHVNDDGAGILLFSCTFDQSLVCSSCRYLYGKGTLSQDAGGAGFRFYLITPTPSISNCMFAFNSAKNRGGGIDSISTTDHHTNLILFCFFYRNSATHGSDIFLYLNHDQPYSDSVVYSFTLESSSPFLSYTKVWGYYTDSDNDWLHSGTS